MKLIISPKSLSRLQTPEPPIEEMFIDVTIDDEQGENHFGMNCREFVCKQVEIHPVLRPVCLILKKMLRKFDMNEPYTGGLGSYSMFLMLLFVHNQAKDMFLNSLSDPELYPAKLLIYFLSFYGNFNPATTMICNYEITTF
jgi:DNA polymerase sigma